MLYISLCRTAQTTITQTSIINHLKSKNIPSKNITLLEAPPLLPPSPQWLKRRGMRAPRYPIPDIFPYNQETYNVAGRHGANFAQILIGEEHMFDDGFHILNRHRHLLHRSIAAAAARVNPQTHYDFRRPPFGPYGPWASPRGVGLLPTPIPPPNNFLNFPPLRNFREVAMSRPIHFRPRS